MVESDFIVLYIGICDELRYFMVVESDFMVSNLGIMVVEAVSTR